MAGLPEILLLSGIMGFSILLSYPVVLRSKLSLKGTLFLASVATGILIFLIADVFSDASSIIYNGSYYGYGSNPIYDLLFGLSLVSGFGALFFFESGSGKKHEPYMLSLMIAVGIGFQNLTEGLVFGSLGVSIGLVSVTLVVLVGFVLQNLTEGFPIISPLIGKEGFSKRLVILLLFIGGIPTILGSGIGYFYYSLSLGLIFDGLAIGSMLYVIFPILRVIFGNVEMGMRKMAYIGAFAGFIMGFTVNLI
ncbi:MAG: hypothetical protein M1533_02245 [Candidatus Thermoplasmatota archaeon]|jgi:ZIP family zinc transporter|nr:hypothetical protein [Candidatus Thermoplasmatota archaeon]MCL5794218.1 hypothetical protein [Candidatus Thermoplasmatota archaeon]